MNALVRWGALCLALAALLLLPFAFAGHAIEESTKTALLGTPTQWGAGLLIVGLLAGDLVLPVPSSLLSTAAGSLLGVAGGTCASWLGMTIGCEIGYHLGRRAGRPAMERMLGPAEHRRAVSAMSRSGPFALLILRAIPVMAEASVIVAGAAGMSRGRFLASTGAANLVIALAYAIIGSTTVNTLTAF